METRIFAFFFLMLFRIRFVPIELCLFAFKWYIWMVCMSSVRSNRILKSIKKDAIIRVLLSARKLLKFHHSVVLGWVRFFNGPKMTYNRLKYKLGSFQVQFKYNAYLNLNLVLNLSLLPMSLFALMISKTHVKS